MGDAIGVTYQQVQKYERGANRIAASTLYRISKALRTPIGTFFPGSEDKPTAWSAPDRWDASVGAALARLEDPQVRKALQGLIDVLGRSAKVR